MRGGGECARILFLEVNKLLEHSEQWLFSGIKWWFDGYLIDKVFGTLGF